MQSGVKPGAAGDLLVVRQGGEGFHLGMGQESLRSHRSKALVAAAADYGARVVGDDGADRYSTVDIRFPGHRDRVLPRGFKRRPHVTSSEIRHAGSSHEPIEDRGSSRQERRQLRYRGAQLSPNTSG
jgi:hypothetical protein